MIFRGEQVKDYHAIANLNYNAFLNWRKEDLFIHEPDMIALARQSSIFDPELSIVAVEDNGIAGHILLMPSNFMVEGKIIRGVILGPVAVKPEHQKRGIGKRLIEYAHEKAKEKGYEFSLLCGHPEYYPKLGYITNTFSEQGVKIRRISKKIKPNDMRITARPLRESDISVIDGWQNKIRAKDSLAVMFERDIMGYHAYSKVKTTAVLQNGDTPVAFIKYDTKAPVKTDFVYFDENYLSDVLNYLFEMTGKEEISMSQPPLHFNHINGDRNYIIEDVRSTCDAFMILPFNNNSDINGYINKVKDNKSMLGIINFPPYAGVD